MICPLQLSRNPLHSGPKRKSQGLTFVHKWSQTKHSFTAVCLSAGQNCRKPFLEPQCGHKSTGSSGTSLLTWNGSTQGRRGSQHQSSNAASPLGFKAGKLGWFDCSSSPPSPSPPKQGGPHVQFILPSLYFEMM